MELQSLVLDVRGGEDPDTLERQRGERPDGLAEKLQESALSMTACHLLFPPASCLHLLQEPGARDFPGGPVVKIQNSARGCGFNPWFRN